MTRRTLVTALMIATFALSTLLVGACSSKSSTTGTDKPAATDDKKDEAKDEAKDDAPAEPTEEINEGELLDKAKAESEKSITADNADSEADKLLKEIESDEE